MEDDNDFANGVSLEEHESLLPGLFNGSAQTLTLEEVWVSLPPRIVVDKVLSAYFNAKHNQSRECS